MSIDYNAILESLKKVVVDLWDNHHYSKEEIEKGEFDIVTETDLKFEKAIIATINQIAPNTPILSEETLTETETTGTFFTVDPVDGTWNYAHNIPIYGTQIALIEDGEPTLGLIYLPVLNQMYTAYKDNGAFLNGEPISVDDKEPSKAMIGITDLRRRSLEFLLNLSKNLTNSFGKTRMPGAACFDYAMVAAGGYQGKISCEPNLWDVAPGVVLAKEAGGHAILSEDYTITASSENILNVIKYCYEVTQKETL